MNGDQRGERGFTLLEVLVALIILILGLAAYYSAFGTGLLAGVSAEQMSRAARAADNLVAQLGRSIPIDDGVKEGELSDGQHWRLQIEPFDPDSTGSASPLIAHTVTLDLFPTEGRGDAVRVQTLVIGARAQ